MFHIHIFYIYYTIYFSFPFIFPTLIVEITQYSTYYYHLMISLKYVTPFFTLYHPLLPSFNLFYLLLSPVQDTVDPIVDEQLALFVVNSHMRSHPDLKDGLLEEERETIGDGLTRDLGVCVCVCVCV